MNFHHCLRCGLPQTKADNTNRIITTQPNRVFPKVDLSANISRIVLAGILLD